MNRKGFTLIELVLVIAILGVLAVSALPNIFNISLTTARENARDAVVGAVQAGLSMYAAQQISTGANESYPATLDAATAAVASKSNPFFGTVVQGGVTRGWTKGSATCYEYTDGGATDWYYYDSTNGTFVYDTTNCP